MSAQGEDSIHTKPLGHRQIHVFALSPGEGNDPLQCHIRIIDVPQLGICSTEFEAISYVWGSQDRTEIVRCNIDGDHDGTPTNLSITRSAADALRAVRKTEGVRVLWIDSICISQSCCVEKTAQVAMMDVIYASATAVLIWLGADDGVRSTAAAEVANLIHDNFEFEVRYHKSSSSQVGDALEARKAAEQRRCYEELGIALSIFECDWFWRLWCVQELALAKQAFIHWGTIVLPWEIILTVAAFVESGAQLHVASLGVAGVYNAIMLESLRGHVKGNGRGYMPLS